MNTKQLVGISKWCVKIGFIVYAVTSNPIIGIGIICYLIYKSGEINTMKVQTIAEIEKKQREVEIMKRQLECALVEDEETHPLTSNLEEVVIKDSPTNFDTYENCVIENYQNRFYRVMKPSGDYVNKIFTSLVDAKKEIDIVAPYIKQAKNERSRIYDIRFVH